MRLLSDSAIFSAFRSDPGIERGIGKIMWFPHKDAKLEDAKAQKSLTEVYFWDIGLARMMMLLEYEE